MYGLAQIKEVLQNSDKIMDCTDEKILAQLSVYLKYVYNDLGQVPNEKDVDYLKSQLLSMLKTKYRLMRLPEIGMAFRNGILKMYGEYYGINFVSLSMFVEAYRISEARCEAVKEVARITDTTRLISAKEHEFDGEAHVAKVYEEFKSKGVCNDWGNLAYDYLAKKGTIDLTSAERIAIYEQAKSELLSELNEQLVKYPGFVEANALRKKIEEVGGERSQLAIIRSKRIAINNYFKTL